MAPAPPLSAQAFFAANVRRFRARAAITQERLAEKAQIDLRYLQRIEAGEVDAKLSMVDRLARALGVPARDLLVRVRTAPPKRGRPPARR